MRHVSSSHSLPAHHGVSTHACPSVSLPFFLTFPVHIVRPYNKPPLSYYINNTQITSTLLYRRIYFSSAELNYITSRSRSEPRMIMEPIARAALRAPRVPESKIDTPNFGNYRTDTLPQTFH